MRRLFAVAYTLTVALVANPSYALGLIDPMPPRFVELFLKPSEVPELLKCIAFYSNGALRSKDSEVTAVFKTNSEKFLRAASEALRTNASLLQEQTGLATDLYNKEVAAVSNDEIALASFLSKVSSRCFDLGVAIDVYWNYGK